MDNNFMSGQETSKNKVNDAPDRPNSVVVVGSLLIFLFGIGIFSVLSELVTEGIQSMLLIHISLQITTIIAAVGLIKMKLWGWMALTAIVGLNYITALFSFNLLTILAYTGLLVYLLRVKEYYYRY